MKRSHIPTIVRAHFHGIVPRKYRRAVARWMTGEDDAEDKERTLRQLWEDTPADIDAFTLDALERVRNRIVGGQRRTNRLRRALAYGAAAAVLAVAAVGAWRYASDYLYEQAKLTECYVPVGDMRDVMLPDSTHVRLNAGSTIVYPERFGRHSREVVLHGEAFFDVTKDASRPFVVRSGNLRIRVLGTRFNVDAYADDDRVTTTLVEGRVSLRVEGGAGGDVVLSPNMQAVYDRGSERITLSKVDAGRSTAWTTGQLDLADMSLADIIPVIERHYGVSITVSAGVDLGRHYSMNFKQYERIDKVLRILSQVSGDIAYRRDGKHVTLYRKGGGA